MSTLASLRPDHVPSELVRDFDFYHIPEMKVDVHLAWKQVQDHSPAIFWTPHNGGHWVATRADDIERMQIDSEVFSYNGHSIPRNVTPSYPLELDPPEHGPVRAILNPLFSPGVIRTLELRVRSTAAELIEGFKDSGRCEFIHDFGRRLPIDLFLGLVNLPLEDRDMLLELTEVRARGREQNKREMAKKSLLAYLETVIRERQEHPGDDVLSSIVNAKIDGKPVEISTMQNLLSVVIFGGLDTVATMMGFFARYLANNPEVRHELAAAPNRIPSVLDELLRRHGIIATGRTVRRDMTYKGVNFRAGDQILVANVLHGLDEQKYPDPLKVDFDRPNSRTNAVFGNGVHRCPGANLGRAEIRIFMEEWLKRIPNFSLDPNDPPVMAAGLVNAILRLPLIWDVKPEV